MIKIRRLRGKAKKYNLKVSLSAMMELENIVIDIIERACNKAVSEASTTLRAEHFE